MTVAGVLVAAVGVYCVFGLLFAAGFVVRGAAVIDPVAKHSGWGFRLLIVPGAAALWPLLLTKWMRAVRTPERGA